MERIAQAFCSTSWKSAQAAQESLNARCLALGESERASAMRSELGHCCALRAIERVQDLAERMESLDEAAAASATEAQRSSITLSQRLAGAQRGLALRSYYGALEFLAESRAPIQDPAALLCWPTSANATSPFFEGLGLWSDGARYCELLSRLRIDWGAQKKGDTGPPSLCASLLDPERCTLAPDLALSFLSKSLSLLGAEALPPKGSLGMLRILRPISQGHTQATSPALLAQTLKAWEALEPGSAQTCREQLAREVSTPRKLAGRQLLPMALGAFFQAFPEQANASDARGFAFAYHLNEGIRSCAELTHEPHIAQAANEILESSFKALSAQGMDASLIIARPSVEQASASPLVLSLAQRALLQALRDPGPEPARAPRSL